MTMTRRNCTVDELFPQRGEASGPAADTTSTAERDTATGSPSPNRDTPNVELDEGDASGYLAVRGILKTTEPAEILVRRLRDAQ